MIPYFSNAVMVGLVNISLQCLNDRRPLSLIYDLLLSCKSIFLEVHMDI